jgi:hypothetical protein
MIQAISTLHPAAQVAAIIAIGACICVGLWQMFKTFRVMIS